MSKTTTNVNTQDYWDKVWTKESDRFYPHFNDIGIFLRNIGAKQIIDLGCGTGTLLRSIKTRVPDVELFGVDISEVGIEKLRKSGIEGVVSKVEDFQTDKKYDVAIICELLEHLDEDNLVIEMAFNLADTVIITVPHNTLSHREEPEHQRTYAFGELDSKVRRYANHCRTWASHRTKHLMCFASKKEGVVDDKKKRVWISVLNEGDINTNLAQYLMDMKGYDQRYDVRLDFPTYKPIQHSRNYIVKQFLETDYDYLVMLDDDVLPHRNILDFIEFDKDILGAAVNSYQDHFPIWTPKDIGPDGKFRKLDIDKMMEDGFSGFTEVDGVGTAAIIIARRVLESIKAPFNVKWYEDGTRENGLDYNFCLRAKKKGFKVWIHSQFTSDHYVTVNLFALNKRFRKYSKEGRL